MKYVALLVLLSAFVKTWWFSMFPLLPTLVIHVLCFRPRAYCLITVQQTTDLVKKKYSQFSIKYFSLDKKLIYKCALKFSLNFKSLFLENWLLEHQEQVLQFLRSCIRFWINLNLKQLIFHIIFPIN